MPYESRAIRCSDSDLDEIIAFATKVFNVDFPNLLPRLYRPGAATGHDHFAVRENGELAAAVISFPLDATVAGRTFKAYGVGTVSVAEDKRGKGYMTDLLASCMTDAAGHGAAISVLGGQRQRYGHYGFARVGDHIDFTVTRQSLRHTIGLRESAFTLCEATEDDAAELVRMMQKRPVFAERHEDDFLPTAAADFRKTYFVIDGGERVGYFVARPDMTSISEIAFPPRDGFDLARAIDELVLAALADGHDCVHVFVPSFETAMFKRLYEISDGYIAGPFANISVLDFPAVLGAFGALLLKTRHVDDGRFVLRVAPHPFFEKLGIARRGKDHGTFGIRVAGGEIDVAPVDCEPDVSLPYIEALEFLFTRIGDAEPYLPPLCRTLLPLPLYFPPADKV